MDRSVTVCGKILKLETVHFSVREQVSNFYVLKLNASPAGGARIIMTVRAHLTRYGPAGVPNGLVEAQNRGNGRTPCLLREEGGVKK